MARVLIVDDAPSIRRVLTTLLAAEGHAADPAASGEEALEKAARAAYDLVILDLGLPGISGADVCRELRRRSVAPILILSVRAAEAEKVALLDAGADDYVTKPFGSQELLARLRSLLRRHISPPPSSVLCCGALQLDFERRRLLRAGKEIRLTPKEFELLHLLMSNAGKVLTHRKLLQSVWGLEYGQETEYLRVFVNQLRRKIEDDPAHPLRLLTEPWVGYRFAG